MRVVASILLALLLTSACVASEVDAPKDQRLAQPVTIECVNVRLHTVLEQICEKTGTAVRCGRDGRDWQVRDIPVTVCAKDVPLGTLLKSIAASTHLLLSKEQLGDKIICRIWRDAKRRNELDDFFRAKDAAARASADWYWDAACKTKDAGDVQNDNIYRTIGKGIGGLLSALGSDGKSQVMAGGVVKLNLRTAPQSMRSSLEDLIQSTCRANSAAAVPLTVEEMQECSLVVDFMTDSDTPNVQVTVGVPPSGDRKYAMLNGYLLNSMSQYVPARALADMPKPPQPPKAPDYGRPEGEWKELGGREAENLAAFQVKVSLEAPKNEKYVTAGTLLSALSKASGYAIVCEDFESHRKCLAPKKLFKKDTTVGAVLSGLDEEAVAWVGYGFDWEVNEKDKLIIGTAHEWPCHHRNLVSEAFIGYLQTKLHGDGVDLGDYLKVMALEPGQFEDWVRLSDDLEILDAYGTPSHKEFWMLYDSLSPLQKAQAQSKEGLPMVDLHPAYVAYLISRYNETELNAAKRCPFPMAEPEPFPYDEQSIANLVMKVTEKKEPCTRITRSGPDGDETPYPGGAFMADTYDMRLEVTQNGETHTLRPGGPRGLPFRSPKREAELGVKPLSGDQSQ